MKAAQKNSGRAMSMPGGLAVGAGISLGIMVLGSAVLAKLVDMEAMEWEKIGYGVMVLLIVSSYLGAVTAYGKIKRKRLLVCIATGGIYWASLLGITALFFGGQYEAVGVTAGLILAGCGSAGLLGLHENRGGKRGKKR